MHATIGSHIGANEFSAQVNATDAVPLTLFGPSQYFPGLAGLLHLVRRSKYPVAAGGGLAVVAIKEVVPRQAFAVGLGPLSLAIPPFIYASSTSLTSGEGVQ